MTSQPASEEIVVIAVDDAGAHLYPSVQELLRDRGFGAGPDTDPVEFFDIEGFRLAPGFGSGWRVTSLVRTSGRPDPAAVLQRLRSAVRSMTDRIDKFPDELHKLQVTRQEAIAMLPDLDGRTLAEAVRSSGSLLGHADPLARNAGNALHNFLAHNIW